MKKNKILVTGGCGYIGSHTLVEIVENTDFEVFSIDNYLNSSPVVMDRIKRITNRSISNYAIDVCDEKALQNVFEEHQDITAIIHFAALKSVPDSVKNPVFYYHNNINSLLNLLKLADAYGVNYFIFSSSCSVYGNVTELPVTEKTPLNIAQSPYAYTKQVGERIIEDFLKNTKMRCISLRYFNPVGAHLSGLLGEDPINPPTNLAPIITRTAAGHIKEMYVYGSDYATRDGSCVRDYIHVCDIASAHVEALRYLQKNEDIKYEVFNLGSGKGITVLEAIAAFEKITNSRLNYKIAPRREGDAESIYSNNDFTEEKLGWKPRYTIEDMMLSAWKWQQEVDKEHS